VFLSRVWDIEKDGLKIPVSSFSGNAYLGLWARVLMRGGTVLRILGVPGVPQGPLGSLAQNTSFGKTHSEKCIAQEHQQKNSIMFGEFRRVFGKPLPPPPIAKQT